MCCSSFVYNASSKKSARGRFEKDCPCEVMERSFCDPKSAEILEAKKDDLSDPKIMSVTCSHFRAAERAKQLNVDWFLTIEDDANPVPDFWRALGVRMERIGKFSTFWLFHHIGPWRTVAVKGDHVTMDSFPVARKFQLDQVGSLYAGSKPGQDMAVVRGAVGYVLSKAASEV